MKKSQEPLGLLGLPTAQRKRIEGKLVELMSICNDMTVDEMGWVGAACLRLIVMKVEAEDSAPTGPVQPLPNRL